MPAARLPRWVNPYLPRGFAPRTARRYTKPLGSPLLTTGTTSAVPLRGVNIARRLGVNFGRRLTPEQPEPAAPAWMPAYEALRQDWNSLIEDARQTGTTSFYAKGYMEIIPRIRESSENPDIPAKSRAPLIRVLENHQRFVSTRKHILDYPGEAERHMDARASLQDVAADRETELTGVTAYPDWRQEAERLMAAGEAILSGKETYGAHLDRLVEARTHLTRALAALREAIGADDKELAERQARELRRLRNRHWVGPRFASDDGATPDTARAMSGVAAPVQAALSHLGSAIGHLVGGQDYQNRMRDARFARQALERSGKLKRGWNRQVDRAAEESVHVIYTDGYDRLHKELDSLSKNMLLDRGVESEIIPTVIDQNPCAHLRMPRDMIFHGWSMRLFQAWQHSATMSS